MASWHVPAPRAPAVGEVMLTAQDVFVAVQSLYVDELKPTGRMIRKRVHEHAAEAMAAMARRMRHAGAADARVAPPPDPRHVFQLCLEMGLYVVQESDKEFAAYLFHQPHAEFVDIDSPIDPYPPALWSALATHLATLKGEAALLPPSRYLCAKVLASQGVKCFRGRSLGQICHIVGLALHKRCLLGFADDCIVPLPQVAPALEVASLKEARKGLLELMRHHGGSTVSEDAVHTWFRGRFRKELRIAELGYSRLEDFLCDLREQTARQSASDRPAPDSASKSVRDPIGVLGTESGEPARVPLGALLVAPPGLEAPPGLKAPEQAPEQVPLVATGPEPPPASVEQAGGPPPGFARAEAEANPIQEQSPDAGGVAEDPKDEAEGALAPRPLRRIQTPLSPIAEESRPRAEESMKKAESSSTASTTYPTSPRSDPEPVQFKEGNTAKLLMSPSLAWLGGEDTR